MRKLYFTLLLSSCMYGGKRLEDGRTVISLKIEDNHYPYLEHQNIVE